MFRADGSGLLRPDAHHPVPSSLQLADDRMALVPGISLDPEAAIGVTKRCPPRWVDGVDEVSGMLLSRTYVFV